RIMAARGGGDFVPSAARRRPAAAVPRRMGIDKGAVSANLTLRWSDYVLLEQIGVGATGKVYRALRKSDGARVAIKFLKKSLLNDPGVVARFLSEEPTVAGLCHPGIVSIHGAGRTPGGGIFLAMELVEGRNLHQIADEKAVAPKQAAIWIDQAARAVAYANDRGVIHCDLKPSNLLLDERGRIRVTDFGFAIRLFERSVDASSLGGTPAFMAPEQIDS